MKDRWWIICLIALAVYLTAMGCVIWPSSASAGRPPVESVDEPPVRPAGRLIGLPYRGIAMQVQRIDNLMDYGRSVDKVAQIGADTILFVVDSKQENGASTKIFLDMRAEPSPDKLGQLIDYAHSRKLRVILMPLVLLESPRGNEWRGTIHPEVWEDWWDSYREMLHFYDTVAERHHVELFVVGSELVSTEPQIEEWTRTIRQVRKDFHGQITYSANWDHYTVVPFWDQLDLMGMNCYYDLGYDIKGSHVQKNQATVSQLNQRWAELRKAILGFGAKIQKPVIMLEVGWCSMGNAVTEPWDYTQVTEPLDLDIQKRLYESYFESWYGQPGLGGFMIWAWTPNASGPQDRGYTPEGKPAEQVLRSWLAKGPWKVE
ncbi:MAG TPA: hypothetical protein VN541_13405 [Tepidisphaeraceae bacterium]|nr:hypothetical protein [Tepidisphaeraceae bacterium]